MNLPPNHYEEVKEEEVARQTKKICFILGKKTPNSRALSSNQDSPELRVWGPWSL